MREELLVLIGQAAAGTQNESVSAVLSDYPIEHYLQIHQNTLTYTSLGVVGSMLLGSAVLSLLLPMREAK